jgi:periplasmic divalent cation tolerance protein
MTNELIIFVTAANPEEAEGLAETLVSEHLAACVNLIPSIRSVYRWQGQVVKDTEVLLIIKSTEESYNRVEQRVKELHSYTTPEIIALRIEKGSDAYLEWLRQSASAME